MATLLSPVEDGTQLLESLGLHPNQLLPQACPAPLRHPPLWGTLGGVVLEDHVGPSLSPSPFSALGGRVLGGPTGAGKHLRKCKHLCCEGQGPQCPPRTPEQRRTWGGVKGSRRLPHYPLSSWEQGREDLAWYQLPGKPQPPLASVSPPTAREAGSSLPEPLKDRHSVPAHLYGCPVGSAPLCREEECPKVKNPTKAVRENPHSGAPPVSKNESKAFTAKDTGAEARRRHSQPGSNQLNRGGRRETEIEVERERQNQREAGRLRDGDRDRDIERQRQNEREAGEQRDGDRVIETHNGGEGRERHRERV